MFITICYAYLMWVSDRHCHSQKMHIINLVRTHAARCSVVFRKPKAIASRRRLMHNHYSVLCEPCQGDIREEMVCDFPSKQLLTVTPKQAVNLEEEWTSFIGNDTPLYEQDNKHTLILIEAHLPKKDKRGKRTILDIPSNKAVKLSELSIPIAWKAGKPFGLVVRAKIDDFSAIGLAFLEGVLQLDDGLLVEQMLSVGIEGHAFTLLEYLPGTRRSHCTLGSSRRKPKSPNSSSRELSLRRPKSFSGIPFPSTPSPTSSEASLSPQSIAQARHLRRRHSPVFLKMMEERQKTIETSPLSSALSSRQCSQDSMSSFGIEIPVDAPQDSSVSMMETVTVTTTDTDAEKALGKAKQKPPNVLVYTDDNETKSEQLKALLSMCLERNCYTVYSINKNTLLKHPWIDNTSLLLLAGQDEITENIKELIMKYLYRGGRLISLCSNFNAGLKIHKHSTVSAVKDVTYTSIDRTVTRDLSALCTQCSYNVCGVAGHSFEVLGECHGAPILVYARIGDNGGTAVLSQVHLEDVAGDDNLIDAETFTRLKRSNLIRHEVCRDLLTTLGLKCGTGQLPALTPCYLICQAEELKKDLMMSISKKLDSNQWLKGSNVNLHFVATAKDDETVTPDRLPVVTNEVLHHGSGFDAKLYMQSLETKRLGKIVLYNQVVPTTQVIIQSLQHSVSKHLGLVSIASAMTAGKGRGGNAWLGPSGCAMFSLLVHLAQHSELGQRLPYLQHIASLAVVEAVCSLPGYKDIDLRLKWPNDIYYGSDLKLGGVLVNSSFFIGEFTAVIGCGVNVDNSNPTLCINDIIQQYNKDHGTHLAKLTVEEQIARTITHMEQIIDEFMTHGKDPFLARYYKRWLHSEVKVRLESEAGQEVTVLGLDNNGFLSVKTPDGKTLSVQPDGNSFDMTKNLITMKSR
ncbi:biotin--protein ligase-like [Glandiceps talaboti]